MFYFILTILILFLKNDKDLPWICHAEPIMVWTVHRIYSSKGKEMNH